MKFWIRQYLILSGALLSLSLCASAQTNDLAARLNDELHRTDEVITRAQEVVRTTRSAQAKLAYDQAVQLQEEAWHQFRRGLGFYRHARDLTLKARDRAQAALSAARLTAQNESVVLQKLERVNELLDRLREVFSSDPDHTLAPLYHSARENLDRAREFYRSNHYRAALKLAGQVEGAAKKLWRAHRQIHGGRSNYERRQQMVAGLVERTREALSVCDSPTAGKLLKQANENFDLASDLAAEGNYSAALQALRSAKELASEAARQCRGLESLERRFARLSSLADAIIGQDIAHNEMERQLLNQAIDQLKLAREHLDGKRAEKAAAALKAAQLSLDRLKQPAVRQDL